MDTIEAYRQRRDSRVNEHRKRLDAIASYYHRRDARLEKRGLNPAKKSIIIRTDSGDDGWDEKLGGYWRNVNGQNICITKDGTIVGGFGKGKNISELGDEYKSLKGEYKNGRKESGNNTGAESSGPEGPADAGASGLAKQQSGEGELAILSGTSASGGRSSTPTNGELGGRAKGDVRPSVIQEVSEKSPTEYAQAMKQIIDSNPAKFAAVDYHTAEELDGSKCFQGESSNQDGTERGTYGAVVRKNGDITGVYNGNGKGAVQDAMYKAIGNGGDRLDAYAVNINTGEPGMLAHTYHKYGFEPVARVKFDPTQANEGVKPQDIVVYKHNGDSAEQVAQRYGTYAPPTRAQYDALPVMGYDEAIKYRDGLIP